MQLSATCRKQLEDAEGKVEIFVETERKAPTSAVRTPTEKALRK